MIVLQIRVTITLIHSEIKVCTRFHEKFKQVSKEVEHLTT